MSIILIKPGTLNIIHLKDLKCPEWTSASRFTYDSKLDTGKVLSAVNKSWGKSWPNINCGAADHFEASELEKEKCTIGKHKGNILLLEKCCVILCCFK